MDDELEKSVIQLNCSFISVLPEGTQNTKEFNSTASIDVLPSIKGNLEYVKPLKISQNQYEDPRKCLKYINRIFLDICIDVCLKCTCLKLYTKVCIKVRIVYKSSKALEYITQKIYTYTYCQCVLGLKIITSRFLIVLFSDYPILFVICFI